MKHILLFCLPLCLSVQLAPGQAIDLSELPPEITGLDGFGFVSGNVSGSRTVYDQTITGIGDVNDDGFEDLFIVFQSFEKYSYVGSA
ncbi:MAG: hypothetical protein AAF789_10905 [Bacteroidota bacterium]